jgi:hypothetical protein
VGEMLRSQRLFLWNAEEKDIEDNLRIMCYKDAQIINT